MPPLVLTKGWRDVTEQPNRLHEVPSRQEAIGRDDDLYEKLTSYYNHCFYACQGLKKGPVNARPYVSLKLCSANTEPQV
jgi:hypothetical protein